MNRKALRKAIRSPLLALALIVVLAGTVLATGASGFAAARLATGTVSESVHFNTGAVKFQTKGPVVFVTNQVTIQPGGSSGWHFHPGVTLVSVASGTVVRYDAHCMPTVFPAGTAFVEAGNHPLLVKNETGTPAVNIVTFLVPAGTPDPAGLRIDSPNPGCPQN
jgi:quercetin dioxygenase-like cupin family protein